MVKPVLRCLSALAQQMPEDFALYGLQDHNLVLFFVSTILEHLKEKKERKKENVS